MSSRRAPVNLVRSDNANGKVGSVCCQMFLQTNPWAPPWFRTEAAPKPFDLGGPNGTSGGVK
jgi:hypothetical protein